MKITEHTLSTMVLEKTIFNRFWVVWVVGWIIFLTILVKVLFVALEIGVTRLNCQRIAPNLVNCQNSQSKILGLLPLPSEEITSVTRAQSVLQTIIIIGAEDNRVKYDRVVILVDDSGIGMNIFSERDFDDQTRYFNDRKVTPENIALQINKFIRSTDPTFSLQLDWRYSRFMDKFNKRYDFLGVRWSVLSLILIILGFFTRESEIWIFDKSNQKFTCQRKSLIRAKILDCQSLMNLQEFQIIENQGSEGGQYYDLELLFKSNNRYQMDEYSTLQKVNRVAEELSNFTGIRVNKKIMKKNK